jgi:flagellar biosynthetic protein FliR
MNFGLADSVLALLPRPEWLLATFLLSIRLGAVFLMTPVLNAFNPPVTVRVLVVVGLSMALALALPDAALPPGTMVSGLGEVLAACATEFALGSTLALGVFIAFGAVSMAGRLLDVQVGFGMAQVIDPATHQQVPILTSAFTQVAALVFFLVDGHHALLRGIAFSLERFPLGRPWPLEAAAPYVLKQAGALFTLGIALAAPVVVCLLLVDLALGVVARNLPQMNMFVVGLPVKIVAGLVALSLWIGGMGDALGRVYRSIYTTWDSVFALQPAGRR